MMKECGEKFVYFIIHTRSARNLGLKWFKWNRNDNLTLTSQYGLKLAAFSFLSLSLSLALLKSPIHLERALYLHPNSLTTSFKVFQIAKYSLFEPLQTLWNPKMFKQKWKYLQKKAHYPPTIWFYLILNFRSLEFFKKRLKPFGFKFLELWKPPLQPQWRPLA